MFYAIRYAHTTDPAPSTPPTPPYPPRPPRSIHHALPAPPPPIHSRPWHRACCDRLFVAPWRESSLSNKRILVVGCLGLTLWLSLGLLLSFGLWPGMLFLMALIHASFLLSMWFEDRHLHTTAHTPLITHCSLPTTHFYSLLTTHYPLLTTHC